MEMTYERACQLLKLDPNRSKAANAESAACHLRYHVHGTPLRFSVAAQVIIEAAK